MKNKLIINIAATTIPMLSFWESAWGEKLIVGEDFLISPMYYRPGCALGTTDSFHCVSGVTNEQLYEESEMAGTNIVELYYSKSVTTRPADENCYGGAAYDIYNCRAEYWICGNGEYWDESEDMCMACPRASGLNNVSYYSSERVDESDVGVEMCYIKTDGGWDHTGTFIYTGEQTCWYDDSGS